MDIRPLTPAFAVSPQVDVADMATLAEAGFTTVICNRPDTEVPPDQQAAAIRAAAEAAGLSFVAIPVVHTALTDEIVTAQKAAIEAAPGPALAYCASGTRSSIVWALGQAGDQPTDEILKALGRAGYDLERLRPTLEARASRA